VRSRSRGSSRQVSLFPSVRRSPCTVVEHELMDRARSDDDRPQAFFPLTSARSEKLVKRFWDTVGSPEALAKLSTTGEDVTVEDVQEVVEEAVEAAVEAVEAVLEGQEKVAEGTTTTSS
jgi:hypothetical protein